MRDPLKEQLQKDIQAFRDEKKPKTFDKKKNWVQKILYILIGISVLGGLVRVAMVLFMQK